jgi:chaperonin GroEL (HSP60 family)
VILSPLIACHSTNAFVIAIKASIDKETGDDVTTAIVFCETSPWLPA